MLINPIFSAAYAKKGILPKYKKYCRVTNKPGEFGIYMWWEKDWDLIHWFGKVQDGVYWTDLNPHLYLDNVYGQLGNPYYNYSGVGDSPEQILNHRIARKYINHPTHKFVLCLYEIRKDDEPEKDGWRWEKWGSYIGKQKPQADYIYDEPVIESVVIYSFHYVGE